MFSKKPSFKSPSAVFGIVALCIGGALSAIGLILFIILFPGVSRLAGIIVLSTVGGIGVIWLIIGLIVSGVNSRANTKLMHLKDTGESYQAEDIVLIPTNTMVVNNNPSVYAQCIYVNNHGQRCKVRSRLFMWNRWGQEEALRAIIYVDRQDPSNYAVEMFYFEGTNGQVDLDFT